MAGGGGQDHFVHDLPRILGMFLQVVLEHLAHRLVHGAHHFTVAELGLGLALELRLLHLYTDHAGEALAEVITGDLELEVLGGPAVVGVLLQRAGQSAAEAC